MKTAVGAFIAGAQGRLLPASIPMRYFGAAVVFHVLAWLALLIGSDRFTRFAGGLDWPLAALHLATLGVLVMTAIGASLQLLPVATLQPVRSIRGPALLWWLYAPSVVAVALGMGLAWPSWLAGGAAGVALALVAYVALLARNLLGARAMPGVIAFGWAALAALLVVLASAASLALAYVGVSALDRGSALALHVTFAVYGFMGLLALGLSHILVPMFALSPAPDERAQFESCALAVAALASVAVAAFDIAPLVLRLIAFMAAALAVTLHMRLMLTALATGLRRELGRSFRLVRIGWVMLGVSLVLALAMALDAPIDALGLLWGLVAIGGWLLTFLLGILQRIVPFLASMHAPRGRGRAPTPSALTAERPLAIHFACHLVALVGLAAGIVADSALATTLAALVGLAGALAFACFFVIVLRRLRGASPPMQARAALAD